MKNIYIIIIISLISFLVSCTHKGKVNKLTQKNTEMKGKNNKQKDYHVFYRFGMFPSEILINNVICEIGNMPGPAEINHYILKKGKQLVKIKIYHPFYENDGLIHGNEVDYFNKELSIQNIIEENDDVKVELIKKFSFPKIDRPVPYIEHTWEFEAELPFDLVGWENSEDLITWDKDKLEEKVLQKFNQLRDLLNSGNGAGFVKELAFANKEYFIANYFTPDQQKEYTNNLIEAYSEHKGIMPPIENYRMRILGDGKVVALENLGKYKGQGVLTAEAKNSDTLFQNYVMLHIPNGSTNFEIVRINSQMASVEEE